MCPLCGRATCRIESLKNRYELCNTTKFYFRRDPNGRVIEWGTTNLSHPRGVSADPRPIIAVGRGDRRR